MLAELLDENDPVVLRYLQFNAIDAYLFPLEWVSGLREKDVINVYRISPGDAQRGFSARDPVQRQRGILWRISQPFSNAHGDRTTSCGGGSTESASWSKRC